MYQHPTYNPRQDLILEIGAATQFMKTTPWGREWKYSTKSLKVNPDLGDVIFTIWNNISMQRVTIRISGDAVLYMVRATSSETGESVYLEIPDWERSEDLEGYSANVAYRDDDERIVFYLQKAITKIGQLIKSHRDLEFR